MNKGSVLVAIGNPVYWRSWGHGISANDSNKCEQSQPQPIEQCACVIVGTDMELGLWRQKTLGILDARCTAT